MSSRLWALALVPAGALALSGCAIVKSGDYGVALDDRGHPGKAPPPGDPLKISAGERAGLSGRYFGVIEVTFENNSPDWIQIDHLDLDFGTAAKNQSVFVPWGQDIETWERATLRQHLVRTLDEEMLLGQGRQNLGGDAAYCRVAPVSGGTVALTGLAGLDAEERSAAGEAPRAPPRFPSTHLLNLPIRIPPGLFVKRWLLLNTAADPAGGCLDSLILGYQAADHPHGRVLLRLRNQYPIDGMISRWQVNSCARRSVGPSFHASAR